METERSRAQTGVSLPPRLSMGLLAVSRSPSCYGRRLKAKIKHDIGNGLIQYPKDETRGGGQFGHDLGCFTSNVQNSLLCNYTMSQSMRSQIAARRAEAQRAQSRRENHTNAASNGGLGHSEQLADKTVSGQVKRAAKSGKSND